MLAAGSLANLPELGTLNRRADRRPCGRGPLQPGQWHPAGQTRRLGRTLSGAGRPLHGSVGSQPPQPCYPGLLPEAAGSWQAEKGGALVASMRKLLVILNGMLKHWLPLVRYDSASRRTFLLTFKTVAIGCSLFPSGFLFQNHCPRFREAPSGFFKGCPQGRPSGGFGLGMVMITTMTLSTALRIR